MGNEIWSRLDTLIPVLIAVLGMWWDNRRRQRKHWAAVIQTQENHWRETELRENTRHLQNTDRLARIETSLKPIADWFNSGRKL
jgi:hypothetical protein